MSTPTAAETRLPLDDVMLAMDVADTLRHRQDLVMRELDPAAREKQLIDKLREIYRDQGIAVPDHILKDGVAALDENRFVYTPPTGGWRVRLARLYVARKRWGRWALALLAVFALALGGYRFVYVPMEQARVAAERVALKETLPARMDALYETIYEETKVQTAVFRAETLRARGKAAAAKGDHDAAEQAVADLEALRDTLRREYEIRIVNREGVQSGFWTFPDVNTEATNYYLAVEAVDADNAVLEVPIENEETGETENVTMWGLRVPEVIYAAVKADKQDDGIIQRNMIGQKRYGFLDTVYSIPVLDGTLTRW